MTQLNVDLEDAIKTLKDLKESTPDRIRRLREEMVEARFDLASQRLLVKWYTWVTQLIEALGPDWRLIGDNSEIEVVPGEGPEIYGAVELNLGGDIEGVGGFTLELSQEPGNVCLRWTCPVVKNQEMDLVLFVATAVRAAFAINEKIAEVRASAKERA